MHATSMIVSPFVASVLIAFVSISTTSNAFRLMKHFGFRASVRPLSFSIQSSSARLSSAGLLRMTAADAELEPMPGSPVVKKLDKAENIATMKIAVSGEATQRAFTKSCELFNEEVKQQGFTVPGFRKGAKLPPQFLYQIFGEDKVKLFCGSLLGEDIQDECENTGLMFVGRGRIMQFNENNFKPGESHVMEIECDLWPEITYSDPGYKKLSVTVTKSNVDNDKLEQVKKSIRGRYKVLSKPPSPEYTAQLGDMVTINMNGFEVTADGGKGEPLPAVASGDGVKMQLEPGKFMDGLTEGIVGGKLGDLRTVQVTFPNRMKGPGSALSGKKALFEVKILDIETVEMPEWDANLAESIRPGMTLEELEKEISEAVDGEGGSTLENLRNDALAKALLEIVSMNKVPESLMEENTQAKYNQMLMDFKEQGSTDEQLQEMATPEKYIKYKEISKPNVEKIVKLGMAFRDIAEKEKVAVTPKEIQDQLDAIYAQARQKGEQLPDERRARDEIENVLLRRKVFDLLAESADITWVEKEEEEEGEK